MTYRAGVRIPGLPVHPEPRIYCDGEGCPTSVAVARPSDRDTHPPVTAACDHTPVPAGYLERAEDAVRRWAAGEVQRQCQGCGLWAVWVPRG